MAGRHNLHYVGRREGANHICPKMHRLRVERVGLMFILPDKCIRGLNNCQPYAQIVGENKKSFFCCGENDGSDRVIDQDKYTLCFKNDQIDDLTHNDKRDLTHQAAVLIQALSVIEELDMMEPHDKN